MSDNKTMRRRHKNPWRRNNTHATSRYAPSHVAQSVQPLPEDVALRVEHVCVASTVDSPPERQNLEDTHSAAHLPQGCPSQPADHLSQSSPSSSASPSGFSADFIAGSFAAIVEPADAHTTALLLAMSGVTCGQAHTDGSTDTAATNLSHAKGQALSSWRPLQKENTPAHFDQTSHLSASAQPSIISRGTVALVLPQALMIPSMSIQENLHLLSAAAGHTLAGPAPMPVPEDLLELLGPLPPLNTAVADLDEQTIQRVALLRALLARPQVLLIDHPAPRLASVLRVIADKERCAVVAATDSADVVGWADRVIVLKNGRFASESRVSPKSAWRTLFRHDARPRPTLPDSVFTPVLDQPVLSPRLEASQPTTRPEPLWVKTAPWQPGTASTLPVADDNENPPTSPAAEDSSRPAQDLDQSHPPAPPLSSSTVEGSQSRSERASEQVQPRLFPRVSSTAEGLRATSQQAGEQPHSLASSPHPDAPLSRKPLLVQRWTMLHEPDPVTQEIATLAKAKVQAIEQASRSRAAIPDPLRDELEREVPRGASSIQLPEDSVDTVYQAQHILETLPGPVLPTPVVPESMPPKPRRPEHALPRR